jgi:hypothetical protein
MTLKNPSNKNRLRTYHGVNSPFWLMVFRRFPKHAKGYSKVCEKRGCFIWFEGGLPYAENVKRCDKVMNWYT